MQKTGYPTTLSLQERLMAQVRNEPRKAGALLTLVAFMGFLWVKIFLFGVSGPAPVVAGPVTGTSGGDADKEGLVSQANPAAKALREFTKKPVASPTRNLFTVKLDYFPTDGSKPAPAANNAGESFWEQLAKSLAARADQEKARNILLQNVKSQAAKLDLQSTVMRNGSPKAMVNGMLLGVGDTIAGFKVLSIEPRKIVVEREGVKVEVLFRN